MTVQFFFLLLILFVLPFFVELLISYLNLYFPPSNERSMIRVTLRIQQWTEKEFFTRAYLWYERTYHSRHKEIEESYLLDKFPPSCTFKEIEELIDIKNVICSAINAYKKNARGYSPPAWAIVFNEHIIDEDLKLMKSIEKKTERF